MVTTVGKESDTQKLFENLISLDYDAIEAYGAAIERLDDTECQEKFREFMKDHRRHVTELSEFVKEMGGDPPTGPDAKQALTKGKVVLADMVGDKTILQAMKSNEEDTNTAYERASKHEGLTDTTRGAINNALADERRHHEWIENRLKGMD